MSLSAVNLNVNFGWSLIKAHTGFLNSGYPAGGTPDALAFSLVGLAATINQAMVRQDTIATSANIDIDVSAYTDLCDNAVTLTKALSLILIPVGTTGILTLSPSSSNGLVWFFGGTAPTVSIPCGGIFVFSLGPTATAQVIDGTHKKLNLANTGATSLVVTTALLGGT